MVYSLLLALLLGQQLPSFPTDVAGIFFSGTFSDDMVLQRSPAEAKLYGVIVGSSSSSSSETVLATSVSVTVALEGEASYTVAAEITTSHPGANYSYWKAVLKPHPAGGNATLTATCAHCGSGATRASPVTTSTIARVTFGDVWLCSGQSNMELPMIHEHGRNASYNNVMAGKYSHIRLFEMGQNKLQDDSHQSHFVIGPSASTTEGQLQDGQLSRWSRPNVGNYSNIKCRMGAAGLPSPKDQHTPCPACCSPGDWNQKAGTDGTHPLDWSWHDNEQWSGNTIASFSAACWTFATALADEAEKRGEPETPIGLIGTYWGGTTIEAWLPNTTIQEGRCKDSLGTNNAAAQSGVNAGELYNGMLLPFANMSVAGVLWYQGENNLGNCLTNAAGGGRLAPGGGPRACGVAAESTGYACEIEALVDDWRTAFGVRDAPHSLPFGVVTLAGGTDEGQPYNMPSMRYAQTGNQGFLPSKNMPFTFSAAAHDLGDPCSQLGDDGFSQPGDGRCCSNALPGGGGWPCKRGAGPHTPQYMGSLHPRIKSIVGQRLAQAARSIAYGKTKEPYTGPVLESCVVGVPTGSDSFPNITLRFREDLLMDDAVMVNDPLMQALQLADPISGWMGGGIAADAAGLVASLGTGSPLQIELNGNFTHSGSWMPVHPTPKCQAQHYDLLFPNRSTCYVDRDDWTKSVGWSEVVVQIGLDPFTWAKMITQNVTGIRYAWGTNPCCPSMNQNNVPCPPASCPIQSFNSSMPAVPFWATIEGGKCTVITTNGAPAKGFKEF